MREKDFAHLVVAGLEAKRGEKADYRIRNIAVLEGKYYRQGVLVVDRYRIRACSEWRECGKLDTFSDDPYEHHHPEHRQSHCTECAGNGRSAV